MSVLIASLFFTIILAGALFALWRTVSDHLAEIVDALTGETPVRKVHKPWAGARLRSPDRLRPVVLAVRVPQPRRAAS